MKTSTIVIMSVMGLFFLMFVGLMIYLITQNKKKQNETVVVEKGGDSGGQISNTLEEGKKVVDEIVSWF